MKADMKLAHHCLLAKSCLVLTSQLITLDINSSNQHHIVLSLVSLNSLHAICCRAIRTLRIWS